MLHATLLTTYNARMIQLQDIQLQRGAKFLLEGASLSVYPGHKLGLIGANGSGKTSLFKLLLGQLHEDGGSISIRKQWQLAHMAQEVVDSELMGTMDGMACKAMDENP